MQVILDDIRKEIREVDVAFTGEPFYHSDLLTALKEAQTYIQKKGGSLAPTPILTQARVKAPADDDIHTNWHTTFTENFGTTDKEGKYVSRGEPVAVTVHGAVILSTPERIREAHEEGFDDYAARITPEEGQAVLHGDFEGDHDIFTYEQFKETTADKRFWYDNLGKRIIVIRPLAEAQKQESGDHQSIRDGDNNLVLAQHPEFIIQTGGVEHAKDYAEYAEKRYKTGEFGVWHDYQENGARLVVLSDDDLGILGETDLGINYSGRFIVVAPEAQVTRSTAREIRIPTLEQIMSIAGKFTSEINQESLRKELGTLYD